MNKLKIAGLFLVLAGFVLPAQAELKCKNEVTVQAGAMVFEGDTDLDTSFIYGARFGHYFAERLSGEVSVFPIRSGEDLTTLYPSLAASYHFRFAKFMPFVQVGAGMLRLQPKGRTASNELAVHWGGGLKYFYRPDWLIRADVDHVIDTGSGRGTNNLLAALGVSYLFGGPRETAAKPAPVEKQPVVLKQIEFDERYFDFDSSTIRPLGKEVLTENAQYLKANPTIIVSVEGYASMEGTIDYNQKLSERRANTVKDFLVAQGVDAGRIFTVGYGEMRPAIYQVNLDSTTVASQLNRRVVIRLLQK